MLGTTLKTRSWQNVFFLWHGLLLERGVMQVRIVYDTAQRGEAERYSHK